MLEGTKAIRRDAFSEARETHNAIRFACSLASDTRSVQPSIENRVSTVGNLPGQGRLSDSTA